MRCHGPAEIDRGRRLQHLRRRLGPWASEAPRVRRKRHSTGCGKGGNLFCQAGKLFPQPNARARRANERYHQAVAEFFTDA